MHKTTRLDNGLTVITQRMVDVHSLSVGLWIKTGGRYENIRNQGISHFMEHMLFKGTKKRNYQQLKRAIEEKGGAFNAFTSEEFVCYYVKILGKNLNIASDVLSDMVLNSAFDIKEIEKERKVIFEEIKMYLDLPMQYVHDLLDEIMWPGQPLGFSLLGTYDTVGFIKRGDFLRQKDIFHVPNNIVAVATGNVEHDAFIKIMEKFFKKTKTKNVPPYKRVRTAGTAPRTKFLYKDTEQTHLCMGTRALSRKDPDRYALSLLSIILGGNMSSRLFNEIREKRSLAYEIGSSLKKYCDTGIFFIHAGIDNKKAAEAVSVIMKELKKAKREPVTLKEFNMAKEYYKSGILMASEDNMSNMLMLGEQMASIGKIITKEEAIQKIDEVSIKKINNVADRIFNDQGLKLAMIGPQKEQDKKEIEKLLYF